MREQFSRYVGPVIGKVLSTLPKQASLYSAEIPEQVRLPVAFRDRVRRKQNESANYFKNNKRLLKIWDRSFRLIKCSVYT